MKKRVRSGQEILDAWRKQERQLRLKREEELRNVPKKCKNCFNSWYKEVPPTGSFTESKEYCGCRLKVKLVDPCGVCELFKP